MRPVSLVLLPLLFAACPEPHSVIGAACDDARDPCPEPLYCVLGRCQVDVPPDTVVLFSDFEAADNRWEGRRVSISSAQKADGGSSLLVTATETEPAAVETRANAIGGVAGLYCASGWVRHGLSNGAVTFELRGFSAGGALVAAGAPVTFALPDAGRTFARLQTGFFSDGGSVSDVRVSVASNGATPADFYLDDVTVLRTVKPTCPTAQ
ncbi:MAG: hypothetical protein JNK82_25205 [Myxococcaceae bacterium]|nr:hypothetical protein [Myxococcaceae bacterium]